MLSSKASESLIETYNDRLEFEEECSKVLQESQTQGNGESQEPWEIDYYSDNESPSNSYCDGEWDCRSWLPDEEAAVGKDEEIKEPARKTLTFLDIMQKYPNSGRVQMTAPFRPEPQYDRGSPSPSVEEVEELWDRRVCTICQRRNIKVVYVACRHGGCVICTHRLWCKGRMKRLQLPEWLRCQECKIKVEAVDLVNEKGVYKEGLAVLKWVCMVSERIRKLWDKRNGKEEGESVEDCLR